MIKEKTESIYSKKSKGKRKNYFKIYERKDLKVGERTNARNTLKGRMTNGKCRCFVINSDLLNAA